MVKPVTPNACNTLAPAAAAITGSAAGAIITSEQPAAATAEPCAAASRACIHRQHGAQKQSAEHISRGAAALGAALGGSWGRGGGVCSGAAGLRAHHTRTAAAEDETAAAAPPWRRVTRIGSPPLTGSTVLST